MSSLHSAQSLNKAALMPMLTGYQSDLQHKPASVHKRNTIIKLRHFLVMKVFFFVSFCVFVGFLKTMRFLYKISAHALMGLIVVAPPGIT